jgi:hypothetical protein
MVSSFVRPGSSVSSRTCIAVTVDADELDVALLITCTPALDAETLDRVSLAACVSVLLPTPELGRPSTPD